MTSNVETLAALISGARRIVFFTGAGASTEPPTSIPDFRSSNGLYRDRSLMEVLSRSTFFANPEGFWLTFRDLFLPWKDAEPNAVHRAPGRLADLGKEVGVVTQNIDGIDRRLSRGWPVYELHGHLRAATCPECGESKPTDAFPKAGAPRCDCGEVLKPDVVLFGDALDFEGAVLPGQELVNEADLVLVVGTSLTVAPANMLVLDRQGSAPLVILNRDPTPGDRDARLVFRDTAGPILQAAIARL